MSNPPQLYFVQIGFAGDCFLANAPAKPSSNADAPDRLPSVAPEIPRHARVLVQTPRGVELGIVLNRIDEPDAVSFHGKPSLQILRRVTRNDDLLIDRLQRFKTEAVRRCQDVLAASESDAVLLDVDQLFDGNTLILHFLGTVDAIGRDLTDAIVRQYESEVQSIRLSELMNEGCGPGCGTDAGGGCDVGGCATCSIACHSKPVGSR